jgi:PAS domain S-box-containing protein
MYQPMNGIATGDSDDGSLRADPARLQSMLQAVMDSTMDGILMVDRARRIVGWNRRLLDLWHMPEELVAKGEVGRVERFMAEQHADPADFLARVAGHYAAAEDEAVDVLEPGVGRVYERYTRPQRLDGEIVGRLWSFRDVTAARAAEEALRASEASYRTIFDLASDAMYVHDAETGAILDVNQRAREVHGHTTEEFARLGIHAVTAGEPPYSAVEALEYVRKAAAGEPQFFPWRARHRSGREFWIEVSLRAADIGGHRRVLAAARDITERRAAEAVLQRSQEELEHAVAERTAELARAHATVRESEERYRALAEADPDGIVVLDDESGIVSVNPAMERIFGYTPEEVIGQPLTTLMPERLRGAHKAGIARYLATGRRHMQWEGVQVPGLRKDGTEVPLEINFGEYTVEGRHCFAGFIRDFTERKRAEEALQHAKEEAERANLAKSEFLSRMSHELRTPLNSILGFGQVLARRDLLPEQRRGVDHIMKAGRHLLSLIDEVLDIARIEANRQQLSVEPVHAGELLEEALALIRPMAQQRPVGLVEHAPKAANVHVRADRQRLMQVVLNLLSNAVKYNRPGGSVELLAGTVERDGGTVLRFGIRDTGPGIPADRLGELFVPFSRLGADEDGVEGTGLGLALSKRLVEAMNGEMRVESILAKGSTFWVELPIAPHPLSRLESYRMATTPAPPREQPREAKKVLYVEDNLANLNLVESIFEDRPEIQLLPALQGRMGLELAREHHPDLILLDLHLPDISGEEVLRELLSDPRTEDVPVLVISADATPRQIQRLRLAGARGYLTKPLDLDEFLEKVDLLLGP